MAKITFQGFCRRYAQYLAYTDNTSDLQKLAEAACLKHARAREPLFCYAYCTGKMKRLLKVTVQYNTKVYNEYLTLYENTNRSYDEFVRQVEAVLASGWFSATEKPYPPYPGPDWLPVEYVKVYRSWQYAQSQTGQTDKKKLTAARYVKRMQENYPELTNEMLAQTLELRLRDVKALLEYEDVRRLSVKNCNRLFHFVLDYVAKDAAKPARGLKLNNKSN